MSVSFFVEIMRHLKLRLQKVLSNISDTRKLSLSTEVCALLLQVAYENDNVLFKMLAEEISKQGHQTLMLVANKADIPHNEDVLRRYSQRGLYEGVEFNMVRQFAPPPGDDVGKSSFKITTQLAITLGQETYRSQPKNVGSLPASLIAQLDLSRGDFPELLDKAKTRKQRRHILQAASHPSSTSPRSQ